MSWYTKALMSLVLSRTRLSVYTTLSALKGVPSWKVTPADRIRSSCVRLHLRCSSWAMLVKACGHAGSWRGSLGLVDGLDVCHAAPRCQGRGRRGHEPMPLP